MIDWLTRTDSPGSGSRVSLVSRHVPDRRGPGIRLVLCRNGMSSWDCGSWAASVLRNSERGGGVAEYARMSIV